ncbi:MAG: restriction endonuclease subunit S [Coriobacteriaceae bacterium]|nr:restriction endonuclease subunit S [Coriobacteriaceae bacterium]
MQSLNEKTWNAIELDSMADVSSGRDIYAQERVEGDTPYVTAGTANNGIGYFVGNDNDSVDSNVISVNRNGAVGEAFFHPYRALFGNDCRRVALRETRNEDTQIFVARSISCQKTAFSYSRKLGTARLKRLRFMLPVDDSGEPDYEYMAEYTRQKREAMLEKYREYAEERVAELSVIVDIPALDEKEWAEFTLSDIFTVGAGKRLETRNKIPGTRPFIGATDNGNGITGYVANDNASKDSNVLGVNYNGAPCIAFYHPYECIFSDDVKRLHLKAHEDNEFVLLFFVAIFAQQKVKYSYGYKFKEQRMLRQKLMLPVDDVGLPDYAYMEQYARNMMLRKYGQYLAFMKAQSFEG